MCTAPDTGIRSRRLPRSPNDTYSSRADPHTAYVYLIQHIGNVDGLLLLHGSGLGVGCDRRLPEREVIRLCHSEPIRTFM